MTLNNAYAPKKSLNELRNKLRMCKQRPEEELEEYAQRVYFLLKRTRDAIIAKYPGGDEGLPYSTKLPITKLVTNLRICTVQLTLLPLSIQRYSNVERPPVQNRS